MPQSISELNQVSQEAFVGVLGTIFEATPTVAEQVWHRRPFVDLKHLHQSMVEVVQTADPEAQLALIRAHPDLGSKAKMAVASVQEQSGAGLDRLTLQEYERFQSLNQAYKERFGFPFIIAVRHHTKTSILNAFEQRLQNSNEVEIQQALTEIFQIAWFRLTDTITQ